MILEDRPKQWPEDDCLDTFWIMLSIICSERSDIEGVLPGRIPSKDSPYLEDGRYNPLISFLSLVSTSGGWWWVDLPEVEDEVHALTGFINAGYSKHDSWELHSVEGLSSKWWGELKNLAEKVLQKGVGGSRAKLPKKFDPCDYNEFESCQFDIDYESLDPKY
ncbi:hypothetical protein EUZ85_19070 [Hahella sp. KA22]|uniref:hypothetical protein n=1 Tax=Hahella sp. KA22 TaxID=1628392 RepID=UPI000FDF08DF|nr:hypothetical protein [Hahella sp. KA22]AZZ92713.1 hypothetical protein ENC22_16495 [Hahella sp. KA22]QAY56087.1 hypothetical protein EUZ85_19070 [Hahella sp. KA22]